jgi:hypothetical protein
VTGKADCADAGEATATVLTNAAVATAASTRPSRFPYE